MMQLIDKAINCMPSSSLSLLFHDNGIKMLSLVIIISGDNHLVEAHAAVFLSDTGNDDDVYL